MKSKPLTCDITITVPEKTHWKIMPETVYINMYIYVY